MQKSSMQVPEPKFSLFLFADTRMAWLWLLLRCYVGYEWLAAGWGKITNSAWIGAKAGVAIQGFFTGAIASAASAHPSVPSW